VLKIFSFVLLSSLLFSCASTEVVKISENVYMISQTDAGGIFGNASANKADVFRKANTFAEKKGKSAIPVSTRETPLIAGRQFAAFEYQFRLVEKGSSSAKNAHLIPRADIVIEKNVFSKDDNKAPKNNSDSLYNDLIKLEDLRDRGILTKEEFNQQKQKILNKN
jgi:hypothetical protein